MANQKERLLEYLKERGPIGPLEAWRELGIYRLSSAVHDLRKDGHFVVSDIIDVSNQYGEKCRVARYSLGEPQGQLL